MSPVSGAADLERKNAYWIEFGKREEQERIIKLLEELGAIRRDSFGHLVAFNTYGTEVIYLPGLEGESK